MIAPAVARRGLVALMNAIRASAAARFDTSARSARVLRPLDAEGRKAEHRGLNRWGERGKMFKVEGRRARHARRRLLASLLARRSAAAGQRPVRRHDPRGPRPLILDEDQHVREWARERLSLRPGITGSWQVLGRGGIPFEEMVRLDYLYVTGWSLFGDLKFMLRRLPRVLRDRREAY